MPLPGQAITRNVGWDTCGVNKVVVVPRHLVLWFWCQIESQPTILKRFENGILRFVAGKRRVLLVDRARIALWTGDILDLRAVALYEVVFDTALDFENGGGRIVRGHESGVREVLCAVAGQHWKCRSGSPKERRTVSVMRPSGGRNFCLHLRISVGPTQSMVSVVCLPSEVK